MAENTPGPLKGWFIEPASPPPDVTQRIKEYMASPAGEEYRLKMAARANEDSLKCWDIQSWGSAEAIRKGRSVTVSWEIHAPQQPENYWVEVLASEIHLEPTLHNFERGAIARGNGKGSTTIELEDGHCYLIWLAFEQKPKTGAGTNGILTLKVGIPLSEESKLLLKAATMLAENPAERLRFELTSFRSTQDAYEEMCREEIAKIKAKGLPPGVEAEQIEDFEDFAKQVRFRYQT